MTGELRELLEQLGKRGFVMNAFDDDRRLGPEAVAFVYDHGDVADVIILHTETIATAYRMPTGSDTDLFSPTQVYWSCESAPMLALRELLLLPSPGHPDAPTELTDARPGLGRSGSGRITVAQRDPRRR